MAEWTAVGSADGEDGEVRETRVNGVYLALARAAGEWFALEDECTHAECPLSDGDLTGAALMCNCHGSEFDVRTGAVLAGPATEPVKTYPLRIVDGRIEIQIS
jgi:nitrite reductase/ring-hydroxylating ferredoxin subunit